MRRHLIACEVFRPELERPAGAAGPDLSIAWMRRHLHDKGPRMLGDIQAAVDAAPAEAGTVLLAYGRCGNGLAGLRSGGRTLVCYRSHDCIPVLIGDRARHAAAVAEEPGTCWLSPGWAAGLDLGRLPAAAGTAFDASDPQWARLVARRGEAVAREAWAAWIEASAKYRRVAWVATLDDPAGEAAVQRAAAGHGLAFTRIAGDPAWVRALLDGPWDDDRFVVVPPGHRLAPVDDGRVLAPEPC
jgi:hypothetical protein